MYDRAACVFHIFLSLFFINKQIYDLLHFLETSMLSYVWRACHSYLPAPTLACFFAPVAVLGGAPTQHEIVYHHALDARPLLAALRLQKHHDPLAATQQRHVKPAAPTCRLS